MMKQHPYQADPTIPLRAIQPGALVLSLRQPEPSWRYLWVVLPPDQVHQMGLDPLPLDRVWVRLWGWTEHVPDEFHSLSPAEQAAICENLQAPQQAEIRNIIDHRDAGLVLVPAWYEQNLGVANHQRPGERQTAHDGFNRRYDIDERQFALPLATADELVDASASTLAFVPGGVQVQSDGAEGEVDGRYERNDASERDEPVLETAQDHEYHELTTIENTVPHRRRTRKRDVKALNNDVKASENDVDVSTSVHQGDVQP